MQPLWTHMWFASEGALFCLRCFAKYRSNTGLLLPWAVSWSEDMPRLRDCKDAILTAVLLKDPTLQSIIVNNMTGAFNIWCGLVASHCKVQHSDSYVVSGLLVISVTLCAYIGPAVISLIASLRVVTALAGRMTRV